jgi:hypothetical protein
VASQRCNQTPYVEEPKWPTHCEHCHEPLESRVVDVVQGEGDREVPAVVAQDVCTHEDCPGKL